MEQQIFVLPNGIRLVHKEVNLPVAHCGVMINAGTRDELEEEQGLAHFIEHVIFKGTEKRSALQIINRLEDVGGDLNAYTAKEETCFHASFLSQYYPRTLELLADILFRSTFPESELEKEKDVIIDEINSYFDSPSEQIFDDFEELVFANHPLGRNILGTPAHVQSFTRQKVLAFMNRQYFSDEIIISSVGNIAFPKLIQLALRHFGDHPTRQRDHSRVTFSGYQPIQKKMDRDTHQTHCVIGGPAFHLHDPGRMSLFLLINMLGGPGMNSRLNLSLRERYGLAYNAEASFTPFFDTGIFQIYFGTFNGSFDKCLAVTHRELRKFQTEKISEGRIQRAKQQLIGQLALANENNLSQMIGMAKSLLVYNHIEPTQDTIARIEAIKPEHIQEIAMALFNPNDLSMLIYE